VAPQPAANLNKNVSIESIIYNLPSCTFCWMIWRHLLEHVHPHLTYEDVVAELAPIKTIYAEPKEL
jgi:hypothetical protein